MDEVIAFGCAECGGKEVGKGGRISVSRVIDRLDAFFAKNDMAGAGRHLEYWYAEARALGDLSGELSVVNELLGYYRKVGDAEKGLAAVSRSTELMELLGNGDSVSGATILLNAATTAKAFGKAADALPMYARVETIYTRELAQNDARMAGFYNNKALALVDLSRFEEAENCYQNALSVLEKGDGNSPDVAVTFVNMAHLYALWCKDPIEAEQKSGACLVNAERVLEAHRETRDAYYAYVCTKCAPSYDYFGFFAYAATLMERAERIYEGA